MDTNTCEGTETVDYCYEFVNGSCPKATRSSSLRVFLYTFLMLIILFTIIGNLLLIISIFHFKHLQTPTNYLILSLATVDFLLGCLVMPYSMVRSVETCWYLGHAFYRYYAMCDPLRYNLKITLFSVQLMIFIIWSVSVVFAFGMIFLKLNLKGIEEVYHNDITCHGSCTLVFSEISGVIASLISFYIPGIAMLYIYCKIYFVAMKQVKSINRVTVQVQSIRVNRSRFSRKHERKAAKTLGIVVGIFLICWSPFFICNTVDAFLSYSVPPVLFDTLVWFGYLNSTLNPLIYGFFFSWFRKAVTIICTCKIFQSDSSRINLYCE
ncbi:trace amine-associated receptor 1-like [Pristis pectinata]|uniref:trace amine-associated receptor 1-like n=1 Tax=Pristis pectinata TaxID=685728 RepID=UPI00223DE872|nr:trace amine-associated receptor 1-like [Pristis pectinata]